MKFTIVVFASIFFNSTKINSSALKTAKSHFAPSGVKSQLS